MTEGESLETRATLEAELALAKEGLEVANEIISYCHGDAWERECTEKDRDKFNVIFNIFFPQPGVQAASYGPAQKLPCDLCGKKFYNVKAHKKAKHLPPLRGEVK